MHNKENDVQTKDNNTTENNVQTSKNINDQNVPKEIEQPEKTTAG